MNTTTLLQNLSDQVTIILLETKSDFSDVPQNILNSRPQGNGWSVLECFEHLNRYNGYYLTAIENAIQKNQTQVKNQETETTWIGRKSIAMMHPLNRKKQKTFKRMDPANSKLTTDVLSQFVKDQQQLLAFLKQASSYDVNAKAVSVEFFKMLKMTIGEALEFVIIHEQRHFIQAREALSKSLNHLPVVG
jgi:uncharacterized damage-inducible protein DinB